MEKFNNSAIENNTLTFGTDFIAGKFNEVLERADQVEEHNNLCARTHAPAVLTAVAALRLATEGALADDKLASVATTNKATAITKELLKDLESSKAELSEEVMAQVYKSPNQKVNKLEAIRAKVFLGQLEALTGPVDFEEGTFIVPNTEFAALSSQAIYTYAQLFLRDYAAVDTKQVVSCSTFFAAEQSAAERRLKFDRAFVLARLAENVANRKAFEQAIRVANHSARLRVLSAFEEALTQLIADSVNQPADVTRVSRAVDQLVSDDTRFGGIIMADQPFALSSDSYQAKLDELAPTTNEFFTVENIKPGYITPVIAEANEETTVVRGTLHVGFGDAYVAKRAS